MALKRKFYWVVVFVLLLVAAFVTTVSWYACEGQVHPVRVEETRDWVAGESPRYWLSQFNLPSPKNVHFSNRDGLVLAGWFIPGTNGATVILAHGLAGHRAEMLPHAAYLHSGGFSVLLFDFRHRGQSEGSEVTLAAKETLDIEGAVDYLKTRPDVDAERIGVQGISLGAVSSILAAVETPEIKGVVAESAFKDLPTAIAEGFTAVTGWPSFPFAPLAEFFCGFRLGIETGNIAPGKVIGVISPRSVFLIHDEEDKQLSNESLEALWAAAGDPRQKWVVPGAPHGRGWQTDPEEYERRVLTFWRQTFGIVQRQAENHRGEDWSR